MLNRISQDHPRFTTAVVIVLLAILTLLAYRQVFNFGFVSYDDQVYVIENSMVHQGLSWEGLRWAMLTTTDGNWFPLTWISYMLDVSIFGVNPGHLHLVNVLYHILNTALLVIVLQRISGEFIKSAAVAALFALHPLHVESVAWISERKDLLSTLFLMLTLLAYNTYVKDRNARNYLLTLGLFICGLMSKPMLVTLPLLLLLLDFWPLKRWQQIKWQTLLVEKIPFLLFSLISSIITFQVQRHKAVISLDESPLALNIKNAVTSYGAYIYKTFVPLDLSVIYPFRQDISNLQVVTSLAILLLISFLVVRRRQQSPWLLTGWLWFLVTLVPVIGIIRVGQQTLADRYTYIPHIGLFILLVWGAGELLQGCTRKTWIMIPCAIILLTLATLTWKQTGYWRDSISLFSHAMEVTDKNWVAMGVLGYEYSKAGEHAKAQQLLEQSIAINPKNSQALLNLGILYNKRSNPDLAAEFFRRCITFDPDNALAHFHLGNYLLLRKDLLGALAEYEILKNMNRVLAGQLLASMSKR